MATISTRASSSDRGAVLVHVAFVIIAMLAISMIVLDFGVFWVSRRQAQNAADAAALAGASSLAFDNPTSTTDTATARESAYAVSQKNLIWGQAPAVGAGDISFNLCPDGINTCVRVDVYRNQAHGNPLPTYFGHLIGVNEQGIRATATAMVRPANATGCLKPWGLPDRWIENYPTPAPWTQGVTFDLWDKKGNPLPNPDVYVPPGGADAGTGFTVDRDFGLHLYLKQSTEIQPGFYSPLQLTTTGGSDYRYNVGHCVNVMWGIGDRIPIEPGNMIGPTLQGVGDLIALDPSAVWVGGSSPIQNSCVEIGGCPGFTMSPRVVAIPVYDVNDFALQGRSGRKTSVLVRNILGFFIAGVSGNDVDGYLMTNAGIWDPEHGTVPPGSAFLHDVVMVR